MATSSILPAATGFRFEARWIEPTKGRPYGVKYSLTLYDPAGRRTTGSITPMRRGGRRCSITDTGMAAGGWGPTPIELVDDFYREVARILRERGVL